MREKGSFKKKKEKKLCLFEKVKDLDNGHRAKSVSFRLCGKAIIIPACIVGVIIERRSPDNGGPKKIKNRMQPVHREMK